MEKLYLDFESKQTNGENMSIIIQFRNLINRKIMLLG